MSIVGFSVDVEWRSWWTITLTLRQKPFQVRGFWRRYCCMQARMNPAVSMIDRPKEAPLLNISVIGLGKVGLALAACLANAGHRIIGVDLREPHVRAVNIRSVVCNEPGLRDRLDVCKTDNLRATTSAEEAVLASDLSFIIVPTPSNTLGGFSVRFVMDAVEKIGIALQKKNSRHVVALVSTVLPGASEHIIIPKLEECSGREIGQTLGYCYNPSFIALGDVVQGIERPDYVLI